MELCSYGCGKPATKTFKNGKFCCSSHQNQCPHFGAKCGAASGVARKGKSYTPERRKLCGKLGRIVTEEMRQKISAANRRRWLESPRPAWNKGKKLHYAPWNKGLRKREPPKFLSGLDPIYSDFKKYRNRVSYRTRREYILFKSLINPFDLKIGKCGIDGAHQIDHIISVRKGFELGISVEIISAKENLQILPWLDNVRKYDS